jgi:class 3 adenylate cyclase
VGTAKERLPLPPRVERRLSAILAADVAGYSRLMHKDKEATHPKLTALLADIVEPAIVEHGGRTVKNTGDGFLALSFQVRSRRFELLYGSRRASKRLTLEQLTQARGFFERALTLDPRNIRALVGTALVDLSIGCGFLSDDRTARLAATEAALIKALSLDPQHAGAHALLGAVQIATNRATQGIAECAQALALVPSPRSRAAAQTTRLAVRSVRQVRGQQR